MINISLKLTALLAGLAVALPTWADSPSATSATADGVTAQGMRVVRDPKTGKLRAPSDAELRALLQAEKAYNQGAAARTSAERMNVERHANGMRSARLGPQFRVQMNADVAADGTVRLQHGNPAYERPAAPASAPQE